MKAADDARDDQGDTIREHCQIMYESDDTMDDRHAIMNCTDDNTAGLDDITIDCDVVMEHPDDIMNDYDDTM